MFEKSKVYLVTDEHLLEGRQLEHMITQAARGGVSMVQLREKSSSTAEYIAHGIILRDLLRPYGVPLIINDCVEVAVACDAHGVHIGQSDGSYAQVRKRLGAGKIIGLSVESAEQVLQANGLDVDYIAASPVFATETKTDTIVEWGLDGLRWMRAVSGHPIVAIGGLSVANVAEVCGAGADAVAVISAIISSDDPYQATVDLVNALR